MIVVVSVAVILVMVLVVTVVVVVLAGPVVTVDTVVVLVAVEAGAVAVKVAAGTGNLLEQKAWAAGMSATSDAKAPTKPLHCTAETVRGVKEMKMLPSSNERIEAMTIRVFDLAHLKVARKQTTSYVSGTACNIYLYNRVASP